MTDEVDELKNIFNDFKISASKVNIDNKNKKKNLMKQKNIGNMSKRISKIIFWTWKSQKSMMI